MVVPSKKDGMAVAKTKKELVAYQLAVVELIMHRATGHFLHKRGNSFI